MENIYTQDNTQHTIATNKKHSFILCDIIKGVVSIRIINSSYNPIVGISAILIGEEEVWQEVISSDNGEVSWDDIPMGEYQVKLNTAGLTTLRKVPWYAEKNRFYDLVLFKENYSVGPLDAAHSIQFRLKSLGYDCGPIDGVIGDKTIAAIKKFQQDHGLEIDGNCGPITQEHLCSLLGS